MKDIYKYLIGALIGSLVAVLVVGFLPSTSKLGNQVQNDAFNFTNGFNAGYNNQFAVDKSGNLTTSGTATFSGAVSGIATSSLSTLTVSGVMTVGATSTLKNLILINGTATTTEAIGSSAIGANKGKLCLWNGANYTIMSYPANSTTTMTVATSTTCLAN